MRTDLRKKSASSIVRSARTAARNKRALILFGRAAWTTLAVCSGTVGFYAGIELQSANYDPYSYADGVAALLAAACTGLFVLLIRARKLKGRMQALETRVEELADRNWELREAEERARSLLESQGDLIVRRDPQGRVTYANEAFCALSGQVREDLIGKAVELVVLEHGAVSVLGDGTRVFDQKIASGDAARWIAWREVAVRSDRGSETQGVGRDVTDRAEAERVLGAARDQAEAASRAKSRFLAMVSHEIRTPLNGMLGMSDLLLETPLTAEQRTYAKAAKTSGETLLSLIEEVLDFSKIEAGRLDLEARPFALAAMVEEVVELLAPRAQAKGIEISSFIDERLPVNLIGDVARLRQVLLNLAGNAIKFTETGGVAVIVESSEHEGREGEVRFTVRDTGIGLAPGDQARIFREFEQADGSPTRKYGGTGLGLAISKRIIERMNGRIAVESTTGAGSTFTVIVPLAAADGASEFTAPDLRDTSVMIVAASELEASLLARRLGRWGARTCVATDVSAARALVPERHWDALLVDAPFATGMSEAAAHAGRRIVLIRPSERHELSALKARGFTGYLVKPVRAASLAARLRDGDVFDHAALETAQDSESVTPAPAKGLSILVAEDNEINALLMRALLTKLGHRATIAGNGEAAVESWAAARAAGEPYDLVLMDVQMPQMDGLQAARRIRASESDDAEKRARILALTANAYPEDREAALAAGMDGFLVKPLDAERLREAIAATAGRLAA